MKKTGFRDRLRYWFDNMMARGSVSMVKVLAITTAIIVVIIAVLITVFGLSEDGTFLSNLWDSLATTLNAWMPYSEEGGAGYIILTAIAAVVGVLFTSVLIGIIGSAIEEKLTQLRKGNSLVLEEGHLVLLGLEAGEFTLLSELIEAAAGRKRCIVVAESMEKDEMEDMIRENAELPKNVRIICRNVDICDPQALSCCSLQTARTVVISPMEDGRVVKTLLAVSSALKQSGAEKVSVVAAVSDDRYLLPEETLKDRNIVMLQSNDIIARIIAHSCTQPGLSKAFTETFNFAGGEIYVNRLSTAENKTFRELSLRAENASLIGIMRGEKCLLNPAGDEILRAGDGLIYYADEKDAIRFEDGGSIEKSMPMNVQTSVQPEKVAVIGYNEVLDTIIRELPEDVSEVILADISEEEEEKIRQMVPDDRKLSFCHDDMTDEKELQKLTEHVRHVVVLSRHDIEEDEADLEAMILILKLRDIKKRLGYAFTLTAEMRRERNRKLLLTGDEIDFIVASDMASLVVAQIAESPELTGVFKDLLSNTGSEMYLKRAEAFGLSGRAVSVRLLRETVLSSGYVFLGWVRHENGTHQAAVNPALNETITFDGDDEIIVIGEF